MEGKSLALLLQSPDPQQSPQPPRNSLSLTEILSAMLPAAPAHPKCDPLSCAPAPVQGTQRAAQGQGQGEGAQGCSRRKKSQGRALAVLGRGVPQQLWEQGYSCCAMP